MSRVGICDIAKSHAIYNWWLINEIRKQEAYMYISSDSSSSYLNPVQAYGLCVFCWVSEEGIYNVISSFNAFYFKR